MASKIPTLVTKALGKVEAFDCRVGSKSYPGWRSFAPHERGTYQIPGLPIVQQFWREFHEQDIRLFVGPTKLRIRPAVVGRGRGGRMIEVIYSLDDDGTAFVIHAMPLTTRRRRG